MIYCIMFMQYELRLLSVELDREVPLETWVTIAALWLLLICGGFHAAIRRIANGWIHS